MTITHKLTLDLQRKGELQRIDVVQGDAFTRQVKLELLCDNKAWNIPVCTPVVRYSKPDGTEGIYDTLPDGMPGVTYSGNTLTLELAPQMLTCAGPVQVQVELNLEDRRLATFTFMLVVDPGVALAGKSEDYVNWTKAYLPQTTGAKVGQYVRVAEVDSAGRIIRVVSADTPGDAMQTATNCVKSVNGMTPDKNGNVEIPVSGGSVDLTGYATEQFVQDGFQPKGDYLPSAELPNAVNDALAQAKESGEFDGKNGLNGLSILTVNITAGDAETIKVYDDNVIENEGAMFPRDIQIGDKVLTEDGKIFLVESWGLAVDSSTGTSVTHYNAKFLINAGGSVNSINGKLDKNQGAANVGKILVVGSDGNLTLIDMPEGSESADVIGTLDESNNILLSGNLADGTYTLKYENADGTYTNVGTLEVGEAGPAYINLAEPNQTNTTDTTIWCNEARLASTGAVEARTGYFVSNFVKVSKNQTLRFKNITLHRMGCYNESKTALTNACGTLSTLDTNDYIHDDYTTVDGVTTLRIENANVAYIRIAGQLTGTAEDVIITVDQEIV